MPWPLRWRKSEVLLIIAPMINYTFHNPAILKQALTHPSVSGGRNYERLELLGDAVLSLVITERLLALHADEAEGDIVKRRAALVNGTALAEVAKEIGLGEQLILGESELQGGGRENMRNLENAMEAVIGAVYEDGGLAAARDVVLQLFETRITGMKTPPKDPKTTLQEWAQGLGKPLPEYKLIGQTGPSHAPEFVVEVRVEGLNPITAEGPNKRLAERLAAEKLLEQI